MGSILSRKMIAWFGKRETRLLILGLDAAGKTSMLYRLKLGEIVTTIPTIGFNVETVQYKNTNFTVWDVGGRDKIRPLWRHYYQDTDAIIFMLDANDRERLDSAREDLEELLREDLLRDCPLLVFANKQDLPNAASQATVSDALKLSSVHNRTWFVQPCSVTLGEGLYEGMEWLAHQLAIRAIGKTMPAAPASSWMARIKNWFAPAATEVPPSSPSPALAGSTNQHNTATAAAATSPSLSSQAPTAAVALHDDVIDSLPLPTAPVAHSPSPMEVEAR
eukprot:m.4796 g.4796  ORF g.4796 m.4796 type:complete len:277 (+) comp4392_c0_seq2:148-978(+)